MITGLLCTLNILVYCILLKHLKGKATNSKALSSFILLLALTVNHKISRFLFSRFCNHSVLPKEDIQLKTKVIRSVLRVNLVSLPSVALFIFVVNFTVILGWLRVDGELITFNALSLVFLELFIIVFS